MSTVSPRLYECSQYDLPSQTQGLIRLKSEFEGLALGWDGFSPCVYWSSSFSALDRGPTPPAGRELYLEVHVHVQSIICILLADTVLYCIKPPVYFHVTSFIPRYLVKLGTVVSYRAAKAESETWLAESYFGCKTHVAAPKVSVASPIRARFRPLAVFNSFHT